MCCGYADCKVAQWSPTGKPEAPSGTPVGRNPEQVPPAKAGARVEGSIVKPIFKGATGRTTLYLSAFRVFLSGNSVVGR
jgi:hypothetical protein